MAHLWQYSWQILHEVKREAANIYIKAAGRQVDVCLPHRPVSHHCAFDLSQKIY